MRDRGLRIWLGTGKQLHGKCASEPVLRDQSANAMYTVGLVPATAAIFATPGVLSD